MRKNIVVISWLTAAMLLSGWGAPDESNVAGNKKQSINFFGTLETWASPGVETKIENISIENLIKQIPMYVKPSREAAEQKQVNTATVVAEAAQAADEAAKAAKQAARTAKKISKGQKAKDLEVAADVAKAAQAAADAAASAAQAVTTVMPERDATKPMEHVLVDDPKTSLVEAFIDLIEVSEIRAPHPDQIWIYQKEKGSRKLEFVELITISKDTKRTKAHYLIEKNKKVLCDKPNVIGPEEQKVPITAIKSLKIEGYRDRELEERERKQQEEREKIKRLAQQAG